MTAQHLTPQNPAPQHPAPRAPRAPRGAADRRRLDERRRSENFPVALRVLPRAIHSDLRAIYDVVRTIDDLGDDPALDAATRLATLDAFSDDLDRAWSGARPDATVLRALVPVIERRSLDRGDVADLIEANRIDQRIADHPDMDSLEAYCRLSAAPIGRLVLTVFDVPRDARTLEQSDQVCTALQIVEHLQDIGEDRRRGRIYLPADVRRGYGVQPEDLDAAAAPMQLRRAIRFMAAAEGARLRSATPLLSALHGWARLAVTGYMAGGFAALDGIRRCGADVLGADPSARRRDAARHGVALLFGRADR